MWTAFFGNGIRLGIKKRYEIKTAYNCVNINKVKFNLRKESVYE